MTPRLLVVEDEVDIAELLRHVLTKEGFQVGVAHDGLTALEALKRERFELIVLDWMLPELSGIDVLKEIRGKNETRMVPVILLTARREEEDRIAGLRLGADDYVAKPFSPQELILRVGAVLRRVQQAPPEGKGGKVVRVGPFAVDTGAARARVDGAELDLTPTEYRLLLTLMERRGRVQSRRQLLEAVWEVTANIATRTVDMHVQRLRNKVGEHVDWIETVRGFGYRFRTDPPR